MVKIIKIAARRGVRAKCAAWRRPLSRWRRRPSQRVVLRPSKGPPRRRAAYIFTAVNYIFGSLEEHNIILIYNTVPPPRRRSD